MRGKANTGLFLYKRRHSDDCQVHLTRLSEAAKQLYFECECPVWIGGTLPSGTPIRRQTTRTGNFREAEAAMKALVAEQSREMASTAANGPTTAWCISTYLDSIKERVAARTLSQQAVQLAGFVTWCDENAGPYMRDFSVDLLETFKTKGWPAMARSTKKTAFDKLRSFLHAAFARGWIAEPLADKVKPLVAPDEQKKPYTDDEIKGIMFNACRLQRTGPATFGKHPETFRLLLELMLETGMRVGDAVFTEPGRFVRGEYFWIYRYNLQKQRRCVQKQKTGTAYISDALKERIDKCRWLSAGRPFFYGPLSENQRYYIPSVVRLLMKSIGNRAGIHDCRPHRLRDTFAVRSLIGGMKIEDVSRLLNHSSIVTTERYYAAWTDGREAELERRLVATL